MASHPPSSVAICKGAVFLTKTNGSCAVSTFQMVYTQLCVCVFKRCFDLDAMFLFVTCVDLQSYGFLLLPDSKAYDVPKTMAYFTFHEQILLLGF